MNDATVRTGLLETINQVRDQADGWGAVELSATFRTLDGECESRTGRGTCWSCGSAATAMTASTS
jgi:hypothetical protein